MAQDFNHYVNTKYKAEWVLNKVEEQAKINEEPITVTDETKAIAATWQTAYNNLAPNHVTNLEATADGNTVTITWDAPATAKGWPVSTLWYIVVLDIADEVVLVQKTLQGQTSIYFNGLEGASYNVTVVAQDGDGYTSSAVTDTFAITPSTAATSSLKVGDKSSTITVTLTGDEYTDAVTNTANWIIDMGTSNCEVTTIAKTSTTVATINVTSTEGATGGVITIKPKNTVIGGYNGVISTNKIIVQFTPTMTASGTLSVGEATGSIAVTLTAGEFSADAGKLANWTYTAGDTATTLESVEITDATHATLNITSDAIVAGTIQVAVKAAGVVGATKDSAAASVVVA